MKRAAALCAISILALSSALPARAADLGGQGCCADLEERVASLESIAAHKGNKKMSLTISGVVDKAYLYVHGIGPNQSGVVDNANSPTMLAVSGEAKLDKDWLTGFRIEIGLDSRPGLSLSLTEAQPTIRTAVAYVTSPVGTVTVGHGSLASDKTGQVSVANTVVASRMLSLSPISNIFLLGYDLPFGDTRRDSVRWDSPTIAGFILSGSVANGDQGPVAIGFATKNAWDLAGRFAHETKDMGGWRVAAAVSYRDEQQMLSPIAIIPLTRSTVSQGSASLMSMSTGLFVNVAAGRVTNDVLFGNFDAYQVQAGWEKTINKLGPTTVFAEYGELKFSGMSATPKQYGVGIVQSVTGLSVDFYGDYKRTDASPLGGPQADTYLLGMRLRF